VKDSWEPKRKVARKIVDEKKRQQREEEKKN